jgi:hypothetical protein
MISLMKEVLKPNLTLMSIHDYMLKLFMKIRHKILIFPHLRRTTFT